MIKLVILDYHVFIGGGNQKLSNLIQKAVE